MLGEKKEILANLKRLKHKNPNHQRGIGYNEGLDNAIVVVQSILGSNNNAFHIKKEKDI